MRFPNHRSRFGALLMVLGIIFVLSCSKKSTGSGGAIVYSSTPNITMSLGAGFSPRNDSVAVGTIVTWSNTDPVNSHTVTSNSGTELNSPLISPGNTYVDTMNTAGIFEYQCTPHPSMTGRIKVQ